uniref:Cation-transporting P-type ATPase N-terminal domain-containing protein n=1 Tax=Heliothis virescens TaxID=7102 RepID=A0A2A4JP48_HELVI
MATVEGRPAQYGVTLRQLRELMESRGAEGMAKINALGGPQEICKKLYTSPTDGPYQFFIISNVVSLF